ncbi:ABC transporter substrate-binding protein [Persicirhabdus sediminis]|uniref:ABC transporter substrate-binding protein n=1 Tax=Persicirhabdus sediminis TaxID=454144 RepID=A0A8J7MGL0_9BACT|nr:ABC transporter substrate-binding protein [Persicirhabdus sediminis]MBK1792672.1 ABC transporter substrate-binding protein [Persicirhabdus sediminis]
MKKIKTMVMGIAAVAMTTTLHAEPLKVGYSDWPGWVAWEIGVQKGWFKEAGVEVDFVWMDYVASMEAYGAGQLDAVCMTNGDALVTGATAKPSVAIVLNDYSNGNDILVGTKDIKDVKDLKGKKVALEEGFVPHLLTLKALEAHGMSESDIEIVNTPTDETPQVLKSGKVAAICAWQPNSGTALKEVAGSKVLFSSANAPGIIYDGLFVSPESLQKNRAEWLKVVKVWYQIVEYLKDEENHEESLDILAQRVGMKPDAYEPLLDGTFILSLEQALAAYQPGEGLSSVYGSSKISDDFNVKYKVYESAQDISKYFDASLTAELAK